MDVVKDLKATATATATATETATEVDISTKLAKYKDRNSHGAIILDFDGTLVKEDSGKPSINSHFSFTSDEGGDLCFSYQSAIVYDDSGNKKHDSKRNSEALFFDLPFLNTFLSESKKQGISVCILSNGHEQVIKDILSEVGINEGSDVKKIWGNSGSACEKASIMEERCAELKFNINQVVLVDDDTRNFGVSYTGIEVDPKTGFSSAHLTQLPEQPIAVPDDLIAGPAFEISSSKNVLTVGGPSSTNKAVPFLLPGAKLRHPNGEPARKKAKSDA